MLFYHKDIILYCPNQIRECIFQCLILEIVHGMVEQPILNSYERLRLIAILATMQKSDRQWIPSTSVIRNLNILMKTYFCSKKQLDCFHIGIRINVIISWQIVILNFGKIHL